MDSCVKGDGAYRHKAERLKKQVAASRFQCSALSACYHFCRARARARDRNRWRIFFDCGDKHRSLGSL